RCMSFTCQRESLSVLFCVEPMIVFFSRRRPHTRSKRDWSSDVCSSDLRGRLLIYLPTRSDNSNQTEKPIPPEITKNETVNRINEIGRASCRERGKTARCGTRGNGRQKEHDAQSARQHGGRSGERPRWSM